MGPSSWKHLRHPRRPRRPRRGPGSPRLPWRRGDPVRWVNDRWRAIRRRGHRPIVRLRRLVCIRGTMSVGGWAGSQPRRWHSGAARRLPARLWPGSEPPLRQNSGACQHSRSHDPWRYRAHHGRDVDRAARQAARADPCADVLIVGHTRPVRNQDRRGFGGESRCVLPIGGQVFVREQEGRRRVRSKSPSVWSEAPGIWLRQDLASPFPPC